MTAGASTTLLASVVALGVALALCACPTNGLGQNEVAGKEGIAAFGAAETGLVFTTRLVVGSSFAPNVHAIDAADKAAVAKATLGTSNPKVIDIKDGKVTAIGPGTAALELQGTAGVIDSVDLRVGKIGATTLVDAVLLQASGAVDARLTNAFAVLTGVEHVVQVAAVDVCGGEMLDLNASTVEAGGDTVAAVTPLAPATFSVKTQVKGPLTLTLKTPGLDDLAYAVTSVDSADVDEVQVAPVTADDQNNVALWGRAFSNDIEVIGDLSFSWAADERVTIATPQGLVVNANVSVPGPNDAPDTRPAAVTAEVFGETGTLDLLTATFVTSRGTPARALPVDANGEVITPTSSASGTSGCGGGGACNPEAAVGLILGWRSLRRLRAARRQARG